MHRLVEPLATVADSTQYGGPVLVHECSRVREAEAEAPVEELDREALFELALTVGIRAHSGESVRDCDRLMPLGAVPLPHPLTRSQQVPSGCCRHEDGLRRGRALTALHTHVAVASHLAWRRRTCRARSWRRHGRIVARRHAEHLELRCTEADYGPSAGRGPLSDGGGERCILDLGVGGRGGTAGHLSPHSTVRVVRPFDCLGDGIDTLETHRVTIDDRHGAAGEAERAGEGTLLELGAARDTPSELLVEVVVVLRVRVEPVTRRAPAQIERVWLHVAAVVVAVLALKAPLPCMVHEAAQAVEEWLAPNMGDKVVGRLLLSRHQLHQAAFKPLRRWLEHV